MPLPRRFGFAVLLSAGLAGVGLAQDAPAEKKDDKKPADMKKGEGKPEEKKPEAKQPEKKSENRYTTVGTIAAKLGKSEEKDKKKEKDAKGGGVLAVELPKPGKKNEWDKTDLPLAPDVEVRSMKPPVKVDDNGKVIKYKPEELKKLKGDSKLPGYPAEADALKPGATVQLTMVKTKPKPGEKRDPNEKPMVHVILIVEK